MTNTCSSRHTLLYTMKTKPVHSSSVVCTLFTRFSAWSMPHKLQYKMCVPSLCLTHFIILSPETEKQENDCYEYIIKLLFTESSLTSYTWILPWEISILCLYLSLNSSINWKTIIYKRINVPFIHITCTWTTPVLFIMSVYCLFNHFNNSLIIIIIIL